MASAEPAGVDHLVGLDRAGNGLDTFRRDRRTAARKDWELITVPAGPTCSAGTA